MLNTPPISELVDRLPQRSITTMVLGALDFAVPGQWKTYPDFASMAREITGEHRAGKLQVICHHADQLYSGEQKGSQRAVWLYQSIDGSDRMLAAASLAHQLGDSVKLLGLLSKVTPKPDTLQALDLAMKVAAEALAHLNLHGVKGENFSEFERSLSHSAHESRMRMAALAALDGVIPLGPDFVSKVTSVLESSDEQQFQQSGLFARLAPMLPGAAAVASVRSAFAASAGWLSGFTSAQGLNREGLLGRLQGVLKVADGKLDTVASLLDVCTDYLSYTGTQTAARHCIIQSWERFRPK